MSIPNNTLIYWYHLFIYLIVCLDSHYFLPSLIKIINERYRSIAIIVLFTTTIITHHLDAINHHYQHHSHPTNMDYQSTHAHSSSLLTKSATLSLSLIPTISLSLTFHSYQPQLSHNYYLRLDSLFCPNFSTYHEFIFRH